ncbi:hypothetical protein [Ornithinimicrobium sp. INDO-MA30-4]|uniref:hypothetical protein n=1 Tax=Ornithinimicrobium sp. INDO-MA30-4 TaxID=2908651 RepID=UPI001F419FE0|nr:hypothetical protein [Ornithinimicrobium sp. INDO-MA30-4]UJH70259.1 hypothetical protein L0A91_14035 [Ornithinimicrobium sp. INDO-MA30-4]
MLADIEAPTYLIQGMSDSLFGLDQADANARALQDAGIPVAVSWYNGGHDGATAAVDGGLGFGGEDDATETTDLTASTTAGADTDWLPWLEATLSDEGVTTDSLPVPTLAMRCRPRRSPTVRLPPLTPTRRRLMWAWQICHSVLTPPAFQA